jgi:hypothetical protein
MSYPDVEICSICRENTAFEQDLDTGEWLSVCCSALAMNLDEDYDLGYVDLDVDDVMDELEELEGGAPDDYLPF